MYYLVQDFLWNAKIKKYVAGIWECKGEKFVYHKCMFIRIVFILWILTKKFHVMVFLYSWHKHFYYHTILFSFLILQEICLKERSAPDHIILPSRIFAENIRSWSGQIVCIYSYVWICAESVRHSDQNSETVQVHGWIWLNLPFWIDFQRFPPVIKSDHKKSFNSSKIGNRSEITTKNASKHRTKPIWDWPKMVSFDGHTAVCF